jgi:hypothetical protein
VTWTRRPRVRPLVVVGVIAVPVLWFGGEYLGSGDPFRGGYLAEVSLEARLLRRGSTPPFWAVLGKASSALPLALLACAPIAASRGLPRRDPILLPLSVGGLAWIGEVAVLAAIGYAGVTRFLFPGLAALAVVGAAGLVLLLRSPRLPLRARVALGLAGLAAVALTSAPRLGATDREALRVERRQDMEQAVGRLLARVGLQTLRTAPHLSSEGVMLTNLAWRLDVPPGPLKHSHLPGLRVAARDKAWRPFWRRIDRKRRMYRARTVMREGRFYVIAIERRGPPSARRDRSALPVVAR